MLFMHAVFFQRIYGLTNKIKKQVLFESFDGKQYSDNPKAVSEMLHEMDPSFQIIWAYNGKYSKKLDMPDYIKTVRVHSKEYYKSIATSFAYIRNTQFESWIVKRNGKQLFFQPWHGDRAIKKILYQANPDRKEKVCDNNVVDYCISGSVFGTNLFREAFKFGGDVLEIGCPRNDILLSNRCLDTEKLVKEKLNISPSTRVLLYAPTFRDSNLFNQESSIDIKRVVDELENKTSQKWVCLIRAHSNVANGINIDLSESMIDVSGLGDAADLLCATDFLITDYSTIGTDYILRRKPVVLAIFDKEDYEKNSRQFSVIPEDTGLLTAQTNEELIKIIQNTNDEEYEKHCDYALNYYQTKETGKSACIIAGLIIDKYNVLYS